MIGHTSTKKPQQQNSWNEKQAFTSGITVRIDEHPGSWDGLTATQALIFWSTDHCDRLLRQHTRKCRKTWRIRCSKKWISHSEFFSLQRGWVVTIKPLSYRDLIFLMREAHVHLLWKHSQVLMSSQAHLLGGVPQELTAFSTLCFN